MILNFDHLNIFFIIVIVGGACFVDAQQASLNFTMALQSFLSNLCPNCTLVIDNSSSCGGFTGIDVSFECDGNNLTFMTTMYVAF